MECVAFEFILDFDLEGKTSAKKLEMQYFFLDKNKNVCNFVHGYKNNIFVQCF